MSWIRWIREAEEVGRTLRRQAARLEGLAVAAAERAAHVNPNAALAARDGEASVRAARASIASAEEALNLAVQRIEAAQRAETGGARRAGQLGYRKPPKTLTAVERQVLEDVKDGTFSLTVGTPSSVAKGLERAQRKGLVVPVFPGGPWHLTPAGWVALGSFGAAAVLAFLPKRK